MHDSSHLERSDFTKFEINDVVINQVHQQEFKRINSFLFPLKYLDNQRFFDDFWKNRS